MCPITMGPFGSLTSGMRVVSRNPWHFRTGRWFLLGESVVLIGCGVAGFVSAAMHPEASPAGAPVLFLVLTPWHSTLLFAFGVLAAAGAVRRRAAIVVTAFSTVVFVVLVFVGAVAAAHGAPGPLGLENADIVLHAVLAAANFAVLYWIIPDMLEGPDWVRRTRAGNRDHPAAPTPAPAPVLPSGPDFPGIVHQPEVPH